VRNQISRLWMAWILASLLALPAFASQPAQSSKPNDQKIQQEVNKQLQDNNSWKNVQANVSNGVVTLTGTVDVFRDKAKLDEKIRKRNGVVDLRDDVLVAGASVSDLKLQETLADKLRYDRINFGHVFNNLTLDVKDGVATVGGTVRTPVDKSSALSEVTNTPGVKGIVDQIKVAPTSIFDDRLRLEIARAIYRRLPPGYALDPQAPIRIVVVNGNVDLYGVVDSKLDRQIAEVQARSIPGVFSVNDHLLLPSETNQ
jgi:hyperosmotically inducible periplasmic protein